MARGRGAQSESDRWLLVGVLSIATFMEVLDTTIIVAALRNIAGSFAVALDQAAWVVTSYLVANAVALPASAWLSKAMGRKRYYMSCVCLFTLGSLACGLAWSLGSLIGFRVLQGLAGGGLVPSEQSIIADAFRPEKRAKAFAVYGVAVVMAPAIGPTLGGWLTDELSWRWVFLANIPIGLMSLVLTHLVLNEPEEPIGERRRSMRRGVDFDWLGFLMVALCLGCLEIVLDQGQRNDWLSSDYIVSFSLVSAISFIWFILWELDHEDPLVDVRLLRDRHFATCFAVMFGIGALITTTTQLLPQLMQTRFGYDATLAGLVLLPRGLATLLFMPLGGFLSNRVQPRCLVAIGMGAAGYSMLCLTRLDPDTGFDEVAVTQIPFGLGLPLLFVPINATSYAGLPATKTDQASSLISVARNLGGSVGVAAATTMLAVRDQAHQSILAEHVVPSGPGYQAAMDATVRALVQRGSSTHDALTQAVGRIGEAVHVQSNLLSYIGVFWMLALVAGLMAVVGLGLARSRPHAARAP